MKCIRWTVQVRDMDHQAKAACTRVASSASPHSPTFPRAQQVGGTVDPDDRAAARCMWSVSPLTIRSAWWCNLREDGIIESREFANMDHAVTHGGCFFVCHCERSVAISGWGCRTTYNCNIPTPRLPRSPVAPSQSVMSPVGHTTMYENEDCPDWRRVRTSLVPRTRIFMAICHVSSGTHHDV